MGASPRARRVGYTVDLASQKLYMASLNKNRFRASLSFQEFEAGLQEALQEHAQMAELKFQAMKAEQDEKDRQLELTLARLERAEETILMLTDRLTDNEAKQADLAALTQTQVALYAQQTGEMRGMVARLRERVRVDAAAATAETEDTGGAGDTRDTAADAIVAGTETGAGTGGDDPDTVQQELAAHRKAQRTSVAKVMQAASKLDAMISSVQTLAAKQRGERDGQDGVVMAPEDSSAAVGELSRKIDALSNSSLLQGRGIKSPNKETRPVQAKGSPQQRLALAGDRLSQLSALVTKLEGAVRQHHSAYMACLPPNAIHRGIRSLGALSLDPVASAPQSSDA